MGAACSSQPSQSKRPRKTSLGLMKQIVAVNKSLKAKAKPKKKSEICFVELKRSAETGQRIYKLKRPKHNNGMKRRISNTVITADEQVLDIDAKNSNWQIAENLDTIDNEELNDINPQSDTKMNSWLETLLNFVKTKKKKKSWFERSRSCQEDWDLLRKNIWRTMQAREVWMNIVMCVVIDLVIFIAWFVTNHFVMYVTMSSTWQIHFMIDCCLAGT
ncbi:uncharacterized protein [Clytia hemisphaerica]